MSSGHLSHSDLFPYQEARRGQEEMMTQIETAVRSGRNACCEAPNGFGKTSVTLCGVLPWVKENSGKLLYCARTHRQLDRVMEELTTISQKTRVTGVSFRGRRHMCLNEFVVRNADFLTSVSEICGQLKTDGKCPFYEKIRAADALDSLLEDSEQTVYTASQIVDYAKKKRLCPYELAKKLAKTVDVVALSYLYVFDPFILETFMPELELPLSKAVLVQDEAHNVPSTALDSASDSLPLTTIRQAVQESVNYNDSTASSFCRGLAKTVIAVSAEIGDEGEAIINPDSLYDSAIQQGGFTADQRPLEHMYELGTKIRKGQLKAGKFPRSTIYRVAGFMMRWIDNKGRDDYAFSASAQLVSREERRIALNLIALDPTAVTSPILKRVHSSVAVSGTLSPIDAYADMLGFGQESSNVSFGNPFPSQNRIALVVKGIDTSYENRSDSLYGHIVEYCIAVAHATPSNTGIFAPSYPILKALITAGLGKKLNRQLFTERQDMKGQENDKLVEDFKGMGERGGAVLLGVQGGRNSEGGDFPGSAMESVVVVGVPYARPNPRTERLIAYFNQRFNGRGRDYAYVLPAMTRAVQAAGRPVRRLTDRGAIVLLDQRFGTGYLRRFMPDWLREVTQEVPDSPAEVGRRVEEFFTRPLSGSGSAAGRPQ